MEAKLKSAYVNKERAAQIAEQEAMKTERMVSTFYVSRQKQCNNKYYNNTSACVFRLKPVLCFSFYRDQCEEAAFARHMNSEQEQAASEQQKLEQKHHEEMLQYQRELELQLLDNELRKQQAYEEFLREKLMVDEIIRNIYEEDQMWVCYLLQISNYYTQCHCTVYTHM